MKPISPPAAPREKHLTRIHGLELEDDYHWLRQRQADRTRAYLEAENDYARRMMEPCAPLRRRLYEEMKGRIQESDLSVPIQVDDCFYYSRMLEGRQYPLHCRKRGSLEAEEEVLLDENDLAAGQEHFSLGFFRVSPDHRLLAFAVDYSGGERYLLRIKDLESGRLLPDRIEGVYTSCEWSADSRSLFYNVLDRAMRPFKLMRHDLGADPLDDPAVYAEEDESFRLSLFKTRSRRFLLLSLRSNASSETRFLDTRSPQGEFRIIEARRSGVEYKVDHRGDFFYLVTNREAKNFRLVRRPVEHSGAEAWEEMIPAREDTQILQVVLFQHHMALLERRDGLRRVRIRDLESGSTHEIPWEEECFTAFAAAAQRFEGRELRLIYSSLITPRTVYDYDMDKRRLHLRKRLPVLGGYDPAGYYCGRIEAAAADGAAIPISLACKGELRLDGSRPLLLYAYGSYGSSQEPSFSSARLSLLDRGVIFAIAHVRGGQEKGRAWYEAGKLLNKRNTFTDFIACAQHLIAKGYTSPQRLAIQGGSAGGLLIGAVLNMRPDLFQAAVAQVPFVDVVNTMLDPSLPLTIIEYEEWGDPNRREYFDYILSYSPYDQVEAKDYPHLLVTAGLNDPRVQYWEPAKWTAKLRALKTDDNLLLLKTNMGAGHSGSSGRYRLLEEIAFIYAFILDRLGLEAKPRPDGAAGLPAPEGPAVGGFGDRRD